MTFKEDIEDVREYQVSDGEESLEEIELNDDDNNISDGSIEEIEPKPANVLDQISQGGLFSYYKNVGIQRLTFREKRVRTRQTLEEVKQKSRFA